MWSEILVSKSELNISKAFTNQQDNWDSTTCTCSTTGSGSRSRSGSVSATSTSGSSGSSQSGSHTGSCASSQLHSASSSSHVSVRPHSASPEIVLVQGDDDDTTTVGEEDAPHSDNKETLSQGTVSLPDISACDIEDTRKALVCETTCKSDVQYGNWWDEQIHQGNEGIAQQDKGINDYADIRKPCKALDKIGPPLAYMEERGVFKPLDTMANLLGLCQFYHTNPDVLKSIPAPKSPAGVHRVKRLLEKAKDLGWPYIIVVFERGNVTPLDFCKNFICSLLCSASPYSLLKKLSWARKCEYCVALSAHILWKTIAHSLTTLSSLIIGATLHVENASKSSQHQASKWRSTFWSAVAL